MVNLRQIAQHVRPKAHHRHAHLLRVGAHDGVKVVLRQVHPVPDVVQQRRRQLGGKHRHATFFRASAAQVMRRGHRLVRRQCRDDEAGHAKQHQHQQRGKQCAQPIPLPRRPQHPLVYRIEHHRQDDGERQRLQKRPGDDDRQAQHQQRHHAEKNDCCALAVHRSRTFSVVTRRPASCGCRFVLPCRCCGLHAFARRGTRRRTVTQRLHGFCLFCGWLLDRRVSLSLLRAQVRVAVLVTRVSISFSSSARYYAPPCGRQSNNHRRPRHWPRWRALARRWFRIDKQ